MFAVFHIGGTHIRVGVSKMFDSLDQVATSYTPHEFEEGIQAIIDTIKSLSGDEKISAIVGGVAGVLDKEKTRLIKAPNLPLWVDKPIAQTVSEAFGVNVLLENDAALGGLGEAVYGAGKDYNIVAYIAVGTGVGGSRIVGKKIAANALGFEPGHQIIVVDGKEDACGPKGHLEAYMGGWAMKRMYGKPPEEIVDPKVWSEVARFLAIGLNNTILHWSPDIVVVTGSVGLHIPLVEVSEYLLGLLTIFPHHPPIVYGNLEKLSGLYGGLAMLKANQ